MKSSIAERSRGRRYRRIVFFLIMASAVYVASEVICLATLIALDISPFDSFLHTSQINIAEGSGVSDGAQETIHPYLGWVHNPQVAKVERIAGRDVSVNWLGFKDDGDSVFQKRDDLFIVGIAGGSVAFQFSWEAEALLKERLLAHPKLHGRTIQFVRIALPGYKQPQQLMACSYLLALGAEFDLILNMDGFNETSLAVLENAHRDTFLSYPRSWHSRTLTMMDPRSSADSARLLNLRGKRQQMARDIVSSHLRWSPIRNLIWYVRDQSAYAELTELGMRISAERRESFVQHGPENRAGASDVDNDAATLWMRCSLQLHRLANANQALYLHVLQPNQYVPDSKPLSAQELDRCVDPQGETGPVVKRLYPLLQQKSAELVQQGVVFSDQTMAFAECTETLYVDPWCHFNAEGNRILCEAISAELLKMLDSAPALKLPGSAQIGRIP